MAHTSINEQFDDWFDNLDERTADDAHNVRSLMRYAYLSGFVEGVNETTRTIADKFVEALGDEGLRPSGAKSTTKVPL